MRAQARKKEERLLRMRVACCMTCDVPTLPRFPILRIACICPTTSKIVRRIWSIRKDFFGSWAHDSAAAVRRTGVLSLRLRSQRADAVYHLIDAWRSRRCGTGKVAKHSDNDCAPPARARYASATPEFYVFVEETGDFRLFIVAGKSRLARVADIRERKTIATAA